MKVEWRSCFRVGTSAFLLYLCITYWASMGLPAIWVLAAVTIGGGILGIAGMLIGVPLTATVYRLFREDVNRYEKQMEGESDEID